MRHILWVIALIFLASESTAVPEAAKTFNSPDGKLIATVAGKNGVTREGEDCVTIRTGAGQQIAERDLTSKTGSNGRYVLRGEWTPDSNFFVFSTSSSGGHSAWHFNTFFYDVKRNRFCQLDDFTGPIADSDFEILPPNTIRVKRLNPTLGVDGDPIDVTVSLAALGEPPERPKK